MTDNGAMRASKIVGSSVYNDHDEKIGSIDDLVISNTHQLSAVVSVGGFLGMGSKMVEVPFDKLQFGNTKGSSDNRVVMPGVTKESLNGMPRTIATRTAASRCGMARPFTHRGGPPRQRCVAADGRYFLTTKN